MPRRLVLLFDGTWNKAKTNTNVERFRQLVANRDAAGVEQLSHYVKGVGVAPGFAHLLGGAFGWGLSENVKQGYQWLSQTWTTDDEIWLFGFSRGAYTARSLGGLIRKCGILLPDAAGKVTDTAIDAAYALYRNALHPDHPDMLEFRATHARETSIRFIGVWDTVGALGIPYVASWLPFARSKYAFHDTELSKIVQYAYQALALDERRLDFAPTKWTRPAASLAPGESAAAWKPEQIDVEQRWFVGAHADIGGGEKTDGAGNAPDTLPQITLAWMQAKAAAAGLQFATAFTAATDAERALPNDSYGQFMFGIYKLFKPPVARVLGGGVNETIDASVWKKWDAQPPYRPSSLQTAIESGLIEPGAEKLG